jgi:hypothetical protein
MKTCNKCKLVKEFSGFNKNKWAKDGYCHLCRECDNDKNKQYYLENKEKVDMRAKVRKYKDIEHYKEINNKYYARNKDLVLKKQKIRIENLSDEYIKQSIKRYMGITIIPPEFIEAKRNLILIQRELRAKK